MAIKFQPRTRGKKSGNMVSIDTVANRMLNGAPISWSTIEIEDGDGGKRNVETARPISFKTWDRVHEEAEAMRKAAAGALRVAIARIQHEIATLACLHAGDVIWTENGNDITPVSRVMRGQDKLFYFENATPGPEGFEDATILWKRSRSIDSNELWPSGAWDSSVGRESDLWRAIRNAASEQAGAIKALDCADSANNSPTVDSNVDSDTADSDAVPIQ